MAEGTAALRAAAPRWSLAADRQLLQLLQHTHQRIISKCNETNVRLEEMARALRDASVNLQNVNNKFLALSNTQFVESRVYDDDADVAPAPAHAEAPQLQELASELSKLKQSLRVLEEHHEPLHILRDSDSDSNSDSDDGDDRLVLKPKDLYADRPLPHIIGSRAWKAKWHAGLVQEESDSDSSASKTAEVEQYSESEEEARPARAQQPERKMSSGSSSRQSSPPAPSAVAAELARRLGGDARIPDKEPLYEPEPAARKLYKPQQPIATTIFPDEPPPLDETSSDDDIFAELHKTRPNPHSNRVENDLFDFAPKTNSLEDALFGRREGKDEESNPPSKPPLFDDEVKTEQVPRETENRSRDDNVKKPVGGISLFGTNKHAETIGAAILKRNRRKSSTSDDDQTEVREEKDTAVKEVKERDIFDDLFAKSEKLNKKSVKIDEPKVETKKNEFSDLFDDIDDIFSTDIVNVKVKQTKTNEKSLFSDDDDLFAEVSNVNKGAQKDKAKVNGKSETINVTNDKNNYFVKESKNIAIEEVKKESKGLFDSDSDDGLFSNVPKTIVTEKKINKVQEPEEYKISGNIFAANDDAGDLVGKTKPVKEEKKISSKISEMSKNDLFDSDDELFTNNVKESKTQIKEGERNDNVTKAFNNNNKNVLFDSDDDGLFAKNTNETKPNENKGINKLINTADSFVATAKQTESEDLDNIKSTSDSDEILFKTKEKAKALEVVESINSNIFNDGDELFKKTEALKETKIETIHDSFDDDQLFSNKSLTNENDSITEPAQEESLSYESLNNDFEAEAEPVDNDIFHNHDEQPKNILRTTRIALDAENVQTEKVKQVLFSDSDDELFKNTSVPKIKESEKLKNESTPSKSPESKKPELPKPDVFSDIFDDLPPVFEKPKEPKKSRNVNALFDDDSDDEALFFKKNDVIIDEKPDFSPTEERFGIFNDEPPAIDVDFTQKPNDVAQKPPKAKKQVQKVDVVSDSALKTDVIEQIPVKTAKSAEDPLVRDDRDTTDNTTKEPKKVGKLKPMNFNINVNSLLPGASPKKKQNDNTDGQTASNEDLHVTDNTEHKMVKSISFDDPEVLDNKISKERAKIQVKRRPSTRRARKEAVRKSAIDLTDSSYDGVNDSTKDNVPKVVKTVYILNDDDIFGNKSEKNEVSTESTKKHLNIVDSDEELNKSLEQQDELDSRLTIDSREVNDEKVSDKKKSFLDSDDDDLFKNTIVKSEVKNETEKASLLDSDDSEDLFKQKNTKISSTTPDTNSSKSISNNIFSNVEENRKVEEVYKRKTILDSDDSDDLFTNKKKETTKPAKTRNSNGEDLFTSNKKGIETLGQVYGSKKDNINDRRSVFDDFASETKLDSNKSSKVSEKANIEKPAVKKSILDDSSDEDDLFKARTMLSSKKNAKSLFGDDDDDENLFGTKTVKEPIQPAPTPQTTKEAKTAEPVFEDPLSLFGNDD